MYKIYTKTNSTCMSKEEFKIKLSSLPLSIQNKISNYTNYKKQQQRIEGNTLLIEVLRNNQIEENLINLLHYNGFGKPLICPEIDFSISYSHNTIVLGLIKKGSIGVDLEQIRSINCSEYKDYFTKNEWFYLSQKSFSNAAFFMLWTRKEAVAKAIGKGAFLDFNTIEILEDTITIKGEKFQLFSEKLEDYCWSVASTAY